MFYKGNKIGFARVRRNATEPRRRQTINKNKNMKFSKILITSLILTTMTSCQNGIQNETKKVGVVEITTFKVKPGIDKQKFFQSATEIKSYLTTCDGFVSRKMVEIDDSTYTDIVFWNSKEEAENTAKKSMENEKTLTFFNFIDEKNIDMKYGTLKSEF